MNLAVGVVAAAMVAAVAALTFLLLRTLGSLRTLKSTLTQFRTEAEPLARDVAGMAGQVASRVDRLRAGPPPAP